MQIMGVATSAKLLTEGQSEIPQLKGDIRGGP